LGYDPIRVLTINNAMPLRRTVRHSLEKTRRVSDGNSTSKRKNSEIEGGPGYTIALGVDGTIGINRD